MSGRKTWTQKEDRALKYLKQELGIKKWSEISNILENEYGILQRNQKQCRQRYYNHLDSTIKRQKLSQDELKLLFKLHDQIGNRWSAITSHFHGRTGNYLKNTFHSTLRGAIRKLNKYIRLKHKNSNKSFPLDVVYKIVQACDGNILNTQNQEQKLYLFMGLKNNLIEYNGGKVQVKMFQGLTERQIVAHLIKKLQIFQRKIVQNEQTKKDQKCLDTQFTSYQRKKSQSKSGVPSLFLQFKPEFTTIHGQAARMIQKPQEYLFLDRTESQDRVNKCLHFIQASQAQNDPDIASLIQQEQICSMSFYKISGESHVDLFGLNQNWDNSWIKDINFPNSYDQALFQ